MSDGDKGKRRRRRRREREKGSWDLIAYDESNVEMLREFEMTRQPGMEGVEEEEGRAEKVAGRSG